MIAADPRMAERTWEDVMRYATHGRPSSQERSRRMALSPALDPIRKRKLIENARGRSARPAAPERVGHSQLPAPLSQPGPQAGLAPRPVLYPALWRKLPPTKRRAATREEFDRIITVEANLERRAYYQLLWETGAAQTDGALIRAEDVDWERNVLFYQRKKLRADSPPCAHALGPIFSNLLKDLPGKDSSFPGSFARRATNAQRNFVGGVAPSKSGISLHSFRYSSSIRISLITGIDAGCEAASACFPTFRQLAHRSDFQICGGIHEPVLAE